MAATHELSLTHPEGVIVTHRQSEQAPAVVQGSGSTVSRLGSYL